MSLYLAFFAYDIRLALRYRSALILNYVFPIALFLVFGEIFGSWRRPPEATAAGTTAFMGTFLNISLVIAVMGNGLWGAGLRAVMERESGILRRFRVAPISALPILLSSLITGLALFLPVVIVLAILSYFRYGMSIPSTWPLLLFFLMLGLMAFRSIGLIVAAVANSTQETTVMAQLLFMPMMLLSGATIPLMFFPPWVTAIGRCLPSFHLMRICQATLLGWPPLSTILVAVTALVVTSALGMFVSLQLFRWDKDEKIRFRAKLLVAGVLLPFLLLGVYQVLRGDRGVPYVPYSAGYTQGPGKQGSQPPEIKR